MKIMKSVLMSLALAATSPAFADEQAAVASSPEAQPVGASSAVEQVAPASTSKGYDGGDIAAEVFLRPAGFIATVIGTGLYLTFLPPVALNSIYPTHEPIKEWAELMVVGPAEFTFNRPIGDYAYPKSEK